MFSLFLNLIFPFWKTATPKLKGSWKLHFFDPFLNSTLKNSKEYNLSLVVIEGQKDLLTLSFRDLDDKNADFKGKIIFDSKERLNLEIPSIHELKNLSINLHFEKNSIECSGKAGKYTYSLDEISNNKMLLSIFDIEDNRWYIANFVKDDKGVKIIWIQESWQLILLGSLFSIIYLYEYRKQLKIKPKAAKSTAGLNKAAPEAKLKSD